MYDLSIIVPTCNRATLLRDCLDCLQRGVSRPFELIVVDGASDDATPDVLEGAKQFFGDRLRIIREEKREGFVRAANKGFKAATGRYMTWLNDDARPLPGAIDLAVEQIDAADESVAFVAMFHRYNSQKNIAYEAVHNRKTYRLCHVRGTLYANFAVGKAETFRKLNYFDERYYFYGADPDLSLKAWNAGLRVEPAYACLIDHDQHEDGRRVEDTFHGKEDNAKLFAKWNLPQKNLRWNDFNPIRPCTLMGLRDSEISLDDDRSVTFVISTHNRRETVLRTLSKLQLLAGIPELKTQTIVVDNASGDGSADAIAERYPWVCLLRQRRNRGACGKNLALPKARGKYIVFLDDDSWPDAGSIRAMISHFEAEPRLGAAVFDVVLPSGEHECSAMPGVFIGCGTGFRREALLATGGLPDDFFMQGEEYDLSLRLLDAGWEVRRFDDLRVQHLKSSAARRRARTTRLDARNNLLVISRRFPSRWVLPYAMDWMRRYRWIAQTQGWRHRIAFWRGMIAGCFKSLRFDRRRAISDHTFEQFAMIDRISQLLSSAAETHHLRSILLVDVGKNLLAFYLAARLNGLEIVGIADARLGRSGRKYRGIPVVDDATARALVFDAAVITNMSPVHAPLRAIDWRSLDRRPFFDLLELPTSKSIAA